MLLLSLAKKYLRLSVFANNKDTDQLVNPHSLIRVFAVRSQELKHYYGLTL